MTTTHELIKRKRYQILVHSLLYYGFDASIIDDHAWNEWAKELVKLQKENPEIASEVIFHSAFENFDGSSGFDLPYCDEQVVSIAIRLLRDQGYSENELEAMLRRITITPSEFNKLPRRKLRTTRTL